MSAGRKLLCLLLIEDSEDDAELVLDELRQGGFDVDYERVDNAAALDAALTARKWDLIISDWTMPTFGALEALALFRSKGIDIPFIIVSGTIGEEMAVEGLRSGAVDFVLKDRLTRLVPAVLRELGEAAHRAEQRRMREQLRVSQEALLRSEKLRALGQMAAGISHDLKNLLNPLSLQLQFLKRAVTRGALDDAHQTIDEMDGVVRRGVETIDRLRRFSRKPDATHGEEVVDLNLLVHEAVAIARPRMASRSGALCTIREELGAPPLIRAGAEEIMSSVVNLVVNAIDALPDGGTITLRTGERDRGAWVVVVDNGPGMPEHVAAQVFEPFFTTKGQEGTGLGLAMVQDCVRRHGGTLKLETSPGQGARFELWFPEATAKAG